MQPPPPFSPAATTVRYNYFGLPSKYYVYCCYRKETGQLKTNWVWTPTTQEIEAKCMTVKFSAARNCYQQAGSEQLLLHGWTRGIYQASNMARKEERDWKKVYLARTGKWSI
jgi:hypothetical protein